MADLYSSVRVKQTTAANFKAHCGTEKGKSEIRGFLDGILNPRQPFDEEGREWCLWLVAGGKSPEEFRATLKSYDVPTICGLVWNKNFVAYRCRDCGISPCMSICADCFHAGNHEGHDFNMFKSQAGGACDCGDENVMKRQGYVAVLELPVCVRPSPKSLLWSTVEAKGIQGVVNLVCSSATMTKSLCEIFNVNEPVSQSCTVPKSEKFWRTTGQSNLADRMEDCSVGQSAVV